MCSRKVDFLNCGQSVLYLLAFEGEGGCTVVSAARDQL
jgi:hypothetical protein